MKGAVGVKGPWTPEEIAIRDRLEQMVKLPENQECADCTARAPKWAVFNHGIFVCIKCSGQHRGLGAAISKVRSITLDRWKPDQLAQMCGNAIANARLLYNLPAGMHKPQEEDDQGRYKWIQQKYVKKSWQWREDQPPPAGQPAPQQLPAQVQEHKHVEQVPIKQSEQFAPWPQPSPVPQPVVVQPTAMAPAQAPLQQTSGNDLLDLFGDFGGPNVQTIQIQHQQSHTQLPVHPKPQVQQGAVSAPVSGHTSTQDDIFSDIFGQPPVITQQQVQAPVIQSPQNNNFNAPTTKFNAAEFLVSNQQQQVADYKPIGFSW